MPKPVTITSETIYANRKWIVRASSLSQNIVKQILQAHTESRVSIQHKLSDGTERWFDGRTGEEIRK